MAISKGMTVEFEFKGTTYIGTVARGGAKPTVIFLENGKCCEVSGSAKFFVPTTKTIELDSSKAMSKFEITGLKEFKTWGDHVGMNAKIRKNGKIIGEVSDDGCGASYNYHFNSKQDREDFEASVKTWLSDHKSTNKFHTTDSYIFWATCKKQFLVSAKDYINGKA